jgi:tRNA modification GTPase
LDTLELSDAHDIGPPTPATAEGAKSVAAQNEREVIVWNKIDLAPAPDGEPGISAVTGAGLERLCVAVLARALGAGGGSALAEGRSDEAEGVLVSTERQRALLEGGAAAAERAAVTIEEGRPAELVAVDLRDAAAQLGRITGDDVGEGVLDALFARFCIGK